MEIALRVWAKPAKPAIVVERLEIEVAGDTIPVIVRKNSRARRLQFRLDRENGDVLLTLPPLTPVEKGLSFVRSKANWIQEKRTPILESSITLTAGALIPIDGRMHEIRLGAAPKIGDDWVTLRDDRDLGGQLAALLKTKAMATLTPLAHMKAAYLGVSISALSYRDTKTRWGSCSADAKISLNWRIVCGDPLLQDYLVAHEVAHLKEPHHQPAFWDQCARLMAQPQAMGEARAKLRAMGPKIMALPLK